MSAEVIPTKTFEYLESILDDIGGISVDSREIKGGIFLAIKGERTDGHAYVAQAFENGARLAIVEHIVPDVNANRLVVVPSVLEALDRLAMRNLSRCRAKIVAVTGSVGKTTTKNLIHHLCLAKGMQNIYTSKKNFNSRIGLPICVATMPKSTECGIFEMGMSTEGDIRRLINILPPSMSVVTKICEAHLQFFNSLFDIAKAKAEIFETKIPQDYAIIPGDSPFTAFLKDKAKKYGIKNVYTFGLGDAEIIKTERNNGSINVVSKIFGEKFEYSINFENVEDSLAAILAAYALTGSLNGLKEGLATFTPANNRGGRYHLKSRNIEIIDDTYNACPTSLKAAIRAMSSDRRKILVVGDMLELGPDAINMHANIAVTIDKYGVDKVFACGNLSKYLFNNLQENKRGAWAEDSQKISKEVLNEIRDGDCVLIKGSHSMNMDFVVDCLNKLQGE